MKVFEAIKGRTRWLRLFKIVIALGPLVLIFFLLNHQLFLTPSISSSYRPGQHPHIIRPENPASIVKTADSKLPWRLTSDTNDFTIKIPRTVDVIRTRIILRNINQPLITFTARGGKNHGDMTTIVYAAWLEDMKWKRITDGNLTLWMRDKRQVEREVVGSTPTIKNKTPIKEKVDQPVRQYTSFSEFKTQPPDPTRIGVISLNPMSFVKVENYQPSSETFQLNRTIRGSHQIYFYAANETIDMAFDVIELNRLIGADNLTAKIAKVDDLSDRQRQWLKTVSVKDDGFIKATKERGQPKSVRLTIPDATPGIYLLDITTSDDNLIKNFTSRQRYLSFANRIYFAEGPAYEKGPGFSPFRVTTNSTQLTFSADHEPGRQTVVVANRKVELKDMRAPINVDGLSGETGALIEKADIVVSGNGQLTAGPFKLIDGRGSVPISIDPMPNLDAIDYLVAAYQPIVKPEQVIIDESYKFADLLITKKNFHFALNTPGLRAGDYQLGLIKAQTTLRRGAFPWLKGWTMIINKFRK